MDEIPDGPLASVAERRVVKSRRLREPGRVVRIPLDAGRCALARQLTFGQVAFYDRAVDPSEDVDLLTVVTWPVAFQVSVMNYAFARKSSWQLLDVVPLTESERTVRHRSFMQDALNGKLSIYWEGPEPGTWGEEPATREECEGLERCAVWDPHHVEDRLRGHFDGTGDKWSRSLQLK